jgi:voltage-gated potassium channel
MKKNFWSDSLGKKVFTMLLITSFIIVFGIIGMHFIVNLSWIDSLYYTIITLSTVGYGAPESLSGAEKIFIVTLILLGMGIVGYVLGNMAQLLVSEKIVALLGKGGDRRVAQLSDHWIICGLGRYGSEVAHFLSADNITFVALEIEEEKVSAGREQGWLVLHGDARNEECLNKAGIAVSKGMIVALGDDADSVYTVLTARSLASNIRIVVRANDAGSVNVLYRSGADKVINPVLAGAASMVRASLQPSVEDFLELVNISRKLDLDFGTVHITSGSFMTGMTLSEAPLRSIYEANVIAVIREGGKIIYNPSGNLQLETNDHLIVFGQRKQIAKLRHDITLPEQSHSQEELFVSHPIQEQK